MHRDMPFRMVLLLLIGVLSASSFTAGCAARSPEWVRTVSEEGLNTVRLDAEPDGSVNSQPAELSQQQVASLLRGVRAWEQRNVFHRLYAGEAPRTRAFRDDEIAFLAPALSKALAQAGASQRVYFHLAHADPQGAQETTSGWIFVRDPNLHLLLSEVHDKHAPGPDISKYDRQMPDVPEVPGDFSITFEPEEYLVQARSRARWFAPDQREELVIRYRDALPGLPAHPIGGSTGGK
jgi:hypothetical protein